MQPANQPSEMPKATREYRRELEFLYAKRSAIDAVILTLEKYDRLRDRNRPAAPRELKQA